MDLSIIGYDPAGAWIKTASTVEELLSYKNPSGISWINVDGIEFSEVVHHLAEVFKIHPLTAEDILDIEQRPKVEEFEDYLFITLKSVSPELAGADLFKMEIGFEQISIVVTENTVITFQEKPGDYFNGIRKRILNNAGRIRRMGTDYLAYAIMDAVVDEYFIILDALGSGIEEFEERAIDAGDRDFIQDIQKKKQELLRVRRVVWPLRESISMLMRMESKWISDGLEPFLKDLHDNIIQSAETVETYRELIAGVMEINLSSMSNRMNNVMKVLTIISTIFIPLTFIVGVYGMNFSHMPELEYPYAYPIVWGIMALIAIGMIVFFKRRHWM
ncbi:magnesium and cobalt transport protein CorA [Spirochaetia bacterium]|nr:magnesium and cobalt transport protein CorA [Spirochaetia bacterium]